MNATGQITAADQTASADSANSSELRFDLDALNAMFQTQSAEKIVEWSAAQFGDGLVMSSSFGAESAVLIHMAQMVKPGMKIIFLDTGYLFPETHKFMEDLRQRFDLNVWSYRTRNDPIAYLHQAGEENPTWRKDTKACCAVNKDEPMNRAMKELAPKAWLRGVRGNQTSHRGQMQPIEWAPRYRCHAISPLLRMDSKQLYTYLKKHDLPYHPLFDQGYASIGCNPLSCTRPVGEGEDPRAGRWSGQDKIECGINITKNSLDSANL